MSLLSRAAYVRAGGKQAFNPVTMGVYSRLQPDDVEDLHFSPQKVILSTEDLIDVSVENAHQSGRRSCTRAFQPFIDSLTHERGGVACDVFST